ncbi:hypothetical protein JCM4914_54640 [Streptomyces platensis subsp. malvinus]
MDFESRAEVIEVYEPQVVPGLLQTREYARACLGCQTDLSAEQLEERVNARISRQDRLGLRLGSPPVGHHRRGRAPAAGGKQRVHP